MCGIVGVIGCSRSLLKSYALTSNLLKETKRRGPHATGFFLVNNDKKTYLHKAPINSAQYIRTNSWKKTLNSYLSLIAHARFKTHGDENDNKNNHPHVSANGCQAIVHNGVINQFDKYKLDYDLESECDSEIILRIIESCDSPVEGIKKVFKLLGPGGDFACLYSCIQDNNVKLYAFRDSGRPLKMVKSNDLNQIFFFSENDIWKDACIKSAMSKNIKELEIVDVEEYNILEFDAYSLEMNKIKVEQPCKIIKNVSSGYYYGNYNTGMGRFTKKDQDEPILQPLCLENFKPECWSETVNEKGFPKFTYDPDKIIDNNKYNPSMILLIRKAFYNPILRWTGWEIDALLSNVISQKEYDRLKS